MNHNRVRQVVLPKEQFTEFLRGDGAVVEGLPSDIEMVNVWEQPSTQTYHFALKSEEFPRIDEGTEIPEANITTVHRRLNNTDWYTCPNCHETFENGDVVR
jgi:hypothetical protein